MLPYQLAKLPLLTESFGESRVFDAVRELKCQGFLPNGEHASNSDICLLIYVLACTTSAKQIKKYVEIYSLLHDADSQTISDAFNQMLGYLSLQERLISVIYLRESGKVLITLRKETSTEEVPIPFFYSDNATDTGVSTYCIISGEWFRKLNNEAFQVEMASDLTKNN